MPPHPSSHLPENPYVARSTAAKLTQERGSLVLDEEEPGKRSSFLRLHTMISPARFHEPRWLVRRF